ncbi:MAG: DEAD/DEAH box helicase [Oryzihumus sp.]
MTNHSGRSSAPKKARWTTAKKAEVKKGPKKPHRGQTARPYDDRAPQSRQDRPARREFDRDDRPQRRFDRDERPARREFNRDDRPQRFDREDRPARREFDRDDRPQRRFDRDERPARREFNRDDRPQRRFDRDERPARREEAVEVPVTIADDNGFAALGLPAPIVARLARDGITAPFPIQAATIPDALAGKDVLGRGQTGSGKTLSFGLPMLTRLAAGERAKPNKPKALVLVPTRELAMQVSDALQPLVHVLGLSHKLVAGGMPYPPQLMALEKGVDLLIATPGRLNDLIERGAVQLDEIDIAVLDEADHMAEMGFLPEITAILDLIPAGGQRLLFSATLDRGIDTVVERYLTDPVTHSTDEATASVATMEHHILLIEPMHKKVITAEVANREGRTVVFVRTKLGADRVAEQLREQGVFAAALHGGLNQGARNRVLGAFRDGKLPVLVATDVAARGIHVDDVSVVLQVDPPADHKDYLHRSGRTARAGDKGTVVTLALPHQRRGMERLAREAGLETVPTRALPGDDVLAATGARTPTGVPVPEHEFRRLLEGEKRQHRRPGGPARPRGQRSGFRAPRY